MYLHKLGKNFEYFQINTMYLIFKKICLHLFIFERQRDRVRAGEGQRERETQNPKQDPGSELSAQSPTQGLNPQTVRS